jgi:hypothetical protein
MVRPIKREEFEGKRNARTGIRINNARIKRKPIRLTRRQIFLTIALLILFFGSSISYVWSNFEGTQIGYDLSRLERYELRLKALNQKLKVELATLKSPQNLGHAARNLGLREPSREQIVFIQ